MKKIEAFKCDHCKKVYQREYACKKHENEMCRQNPKLKAYCFYGCKHLTMEKGVVSDGYYGDFERTVEFLYCKKHEKHIIPFWVVRKQNQYESIDLNGEELEDMEAPMSCEDFKQQDWITKITNQPLC